MKYLCLCYYDANDFSKLTEQDFKEVGEICQVHDAAFKQTGQVRMIASLELPEKSHVIRPGKKDGDAPTTEAGAFRETDMPLGALFIVEAESIQEAIDIAKKHPGAHLGRLFDGAIEVRPIDAFEIP